MDYIICDMTVAGAEAEFYLNDIPLSRLAPNHCEREAMPVNHLLIRGENRLGILIKPGSAPANARAQVCAEITSDAIRVNARLSAYPLGAIPGEDSGRDLANLEHKILDGTVTGFPHFVESRFNYGNPVARWAWQDSQQLTLDNVLVMTVHRLLTNITDSLQRGDPTVFLSLSTIRFDEVCVAFQEDVSQRRQRWTDGLDQLSQEPNWIFVKPLPETMSLRLCADSRMIDCSASDWKPIIRARQNEHGVFLVHYPILLANISGDIQIVR